MSNYDSLNNYQHGYQIENSNYGDHEHEAESVVGSNYNYQVAENGYVDGNNYGYQVQEEEVSQVPSQVHTVDAIPVSGQQSNSMYDEVKVRSPAIQNINLEVKARPILEDQSVIVPARCWAKELVQLQMIASMPERRRKLVEWHDALVETAVRHADRIISALHDPAKLASMTAGMGGIAGGTKFIFDGLVFKLASDPNIRGNYLYGGGKTPNLERAAKAASQELKGANALFECLYEQKLDATVPMQVMLDYCGERLVAMPLLPIKGSETLIYGSCDGGHQVFADPLIHQYLGGVCSQLHLAEHLVMSDSGPVKLWVAGDVEGHRGSDGRLYLLDLARTFPPEDPRLVTHLPPCLSAIWFRLIRPEFLRLLKTESMPALSSDSFSKWGSPDMSHNQNARKATELLLHTQIPKLASHLTSFLNSASIAKHSPLAESFPSPFPTQYAQTLLQSPITAEHLFSSLSAFLHVKSDVPDWAANTTFYPSNYIQSVDLSKEFHDWGVPMRHLGLVHEAVFLPELRQILVREAVSRSFKNMIRTDLRECGISGAVRSATQVLADWFDLIVRGPSVMKGYVSASPEEKAIVMHVWTKRLPEDLSARFGDLVRGISSLANIMEHHVYRIVYYLVQSIGVQLSVAGNIKMARMCSAGHSLTFGAPGRIPDIVCTTCGVAVASSYAHSCALCDFYCCVDCFGNPHQLIQFTVADIQKFSPRLKTMSFISVIQAQRLADQAVELVLDTSQSEKERLEQLQKLMQEVKSVCEKLLRTDPSCTPIKERLRFATHAVQLLSAASPAEKRFYSDKFLRTFQSEIANNKGLISDGLRMMTAVGAICDRMMVAKAAKFQNLSLIRGIVEAGGTVGGAVGVAIAQGNRVATAYLLEVMRKQFKVEEKVSDSNNHFMRKTVIRPMNPCLEQHAFHWICRSCPFSFCHVKVPQTTTSLSRPSADRVLLRFHHAVDPTTHNHPLVYKERPNNSKPSSCASCKKPVEKSVWFCAECNLTWCLTCVEPKNDSYPCSFISPLDTSTIDDGMLRTIAFGLQDNHAISSVELVGCPFSVRATNDFFSHSSFSPSFTALDFSGNCFDLQAMQRFSAVVSTMNLRQLTLAKIPSFSTFLQCFCQGLLNTRVEYLDLSYNNNFGDLLLAEFQRAVVSTSSLPETLRKLSLDSTNMTAVGVSVLLALNWKITDLVVSNNQLGNEGLLMLIQATNSSLRNVDAHANQSTPAGYECLSDALLTTSLHSISFNYPLTLPLHLLHISPTQFTSNYFCTKGHVLTKAANAKVYQTNIAFCNSCKCQSPVQDVWSCSACSYDICTGCVSVVLLGNHLDMGGIFDASSFNASLLELIYIVKQCQQHQYRYVLFESGFVLSLSSYLNLTVLDLSQQKCHLPATAHVLATVSMPDTLQRIVLKFTGSSESQDMYYDVLLAKLVNHPSLTDLELHEAPITEAFLKVLQHGSRLKRLKLKWKQRKITAGFSLLKALTPTVGNLAFLELSGLLLLDLLDNVPAYTGGNVDHPFFCFTGPQTVRLLRCIVPPQYAAQLFQAIACNQSLHTFHFTQQNATTFATERGSDIAKAVVSIFSSCPKLSNVLFDKLASDSKNNLFHETFHQLAWPALANNTSLTFLKLKPICRGCWEPYVEALRKRPGMIHVDWSDDCGYSPTPIIVNLLPKLSGLNMYRALLTPQIGKDVFTALLASAAQPRGPLHSLALTQVTTSAKNLEGSIGLCGQVLASPVLQVRELCLHNIVLDAEWVAALKQSGLNQLDLSGRNNKIDIALVVDVVVSLRSLTAINIHNRIMEKLGPGLLAMIDGNPGLQKIIASRCSLPYSDYLTVLTAALGPKSSLMYLDVAPFTNDIDTATDYAVQEMLWKSQKPFLFLPTPKTDRANFLHWARMDKLGSPQFPKWCSPKCHAPN